MQRSPQQSCCRLRTFPRSCCASNSARLRASTSISAFFVSNSARVCAITALTTVKRGNLPAMSTQHKRTWDERMRDSASFFLVSSTFFADRSNVLFRESWEHADTKRHYWRSTQQQCSTASAPWTSPDLARRDEPWPPSAQSSFSSAAGAHRHAAGRQLCTSSSYHHPHYHHRHQHPPTTASPAPCSARPSQRAAAAPPRAPWPRGGSWTGGRRARSPRPGAPACPSARGCAPSAPPASCPAVGITQQVIGGEGQEGGRAEGAAAAEGLATAPTATIAW